MTLPTFIQWYCILRPHYRRTVFESISRRVSEFDYVGFANGKKLDSVTVHESHLVEIDSYTAGFRSNQLSKRVNILCVKSSTHTENTKVFSDDQTLSSEGHLCRFLTFQNSQPLQHVLSLQASTEPLLTH